MFGLFIVPTILAMIHGGVISIHDVWHAQNPEVEHIGCAPHEIHSGPVMQTGWWQDEYDSATGHMVRVWVTNEDSPVVDTIPCTETEQEAADIQWTAKLRRVRGDIIRNVQESVQPSSHTQEEHDEPAPVVSPLPPNPYVHSL